MTMDMTDIIGNSSPIETTKYETEEIIEKRRKIEGMEPVYIP